MLYVVALCVCVLITQVVSTASERFRSNSSEKRTDQVLLFLKTFLKLK